MSSGRDLRRVAAIGDSIFAVVVTLLAYRVRIPSPEDFAQGSLTPLMPFLNDMMAVVLSFFVASMLYIAHWRVFRRLRRCDLQFVASNLAFLGTMVLLPITTRIMSSSFMSTPGALIYSLNLFLAAFMQIFLRKHARRLDPTAFSHGNVLLTPFVMMTIFGTAAIVSIYSPTLAPLFWIGALISPWVDYRWGIGPPPEAGSTSTSVS